MRVLSLSHIEKNKNRLIESTLKKEDLLIADSPTLYRKSISILRGFQSKSNGINIHFNNPVITELAMSQGVFSELSGEDFNDFEKNKWLSMYNDSCELIDSITPKLLDLIKSITTDILFVKSTRVGGGTGSHLPGLICISPDERWDKIDLAQCLIHEATHLTTFLCDMVFKLYSKPSSELEANEYRVLSAVRIGELRPLDKALHSGLVAVPLMYFEDKLGRTALVSQFSESIKDCSKGLIEKKEYFTKYGNKVVEDFNYFCNTLDYDFVENSLNWDDAYCLC
ncbi:aKG-HExxH-type peptide beta-hydroxylase [Tenacibaculum aiptasiae]|uniref:aKG-HExxH-type peptide beta-hydroxylase n=1 Tax=Tenacibaculum aiptasiae TaxID=426481 RepID=UPI003B5B2F1E